MVNVLIEIVVDVTEHKITVFPYQDNILSLFYPCLSHPDTDRDQYYAGRLFTVGWNIGYMIILQG